MSSYIQQTNNGIVYNLQMFRSLEEKIENYSESAELNGSDITRNAILKAILDDLDSQRILYANIIKEPNVMRLFKKFDQNILSNGGLKKIDARLLSRYLTHINGIFGFDWRNRSNADANDFFMTHCMVLKDELDKYLSQSADNSQVDLNRKECFMQILAFRVNNRLAYPHFALFEILKREYDIDVLQGKNIDQIPYDLIMRATYAWEKILIEKQYKGEPTYELEENAWREEYTMIYNYIQNKAKTTSPERLLLDAPIIMEFFNIANSRRDYMGGAMYPSNYVIDLSKNILSMLPPPSPISTDELNFMSQCNEKYQKRDMVPEDLKKFIGIYLKILYEKIYNPQLKEDSTGKYSEIFSDLLLGQYGRNNPFFMSRRNSQTQVYQNLTRLLVYDYTMSLGRKFSGSPASRITLENELDDVTYYGEARPPIMEVSIRNAVSNEMKDVIITIGHENKHIQDFISFFSNKPSDSIQYIAMKLVYMSMMHKYLADNSFNYLINPLEKIARYAGNAWLLAFYERHGIDQKYPEKYNEIVKEQNMELESLENYDLIDNPLYCDNKDRVEEAKKGGLVFYEDGEKISITKIFDRFAKKEMVGYIFPGHFFSLEYNQDGTRKTIQELLEEMGRLDESDENNGLRGVYKDIIKLRLYGY